MAKELTAIAVQKAQPRERIYKLAAGGSLYVEVWPNARKYWRWKYTFGGKEKRLALGVFPEVSLADARRARDRARDLLRQGVDPGAQRRVEKLTRVVAGQNTFAETAREWYAVVRPEWSDTHAEKVQARLTNDILPALGGRPVAAITTPECLAVLRNIEARGAIDTARRCRQTMSHVFRYAISTGRAERDPAADLAGVLKRPEKGHFPTITAPARIGQLLRAIDAYTGTFSTRAALRLAPLVFVRPGELRMAEWQEMDLDASQWTIPPVRLKLRKAAKISSPPLIVPLSRQAVALLRDLHLITGYGRYVFPSPNDPRKPLSENTINAALHALGFKGELVGHGLRHMASTLLNEQGWNPDAIERQLAHRDRNRVRAVYNQALYIAERKQMMQAWSDYLSTLREGASVVQLKRA